MPVYPYDCPKCGHREDVLKSMSRCRDPEDCPLCGAVMIKDCMMPRIGSRRERGIDPAYQKPIEMFAVAPETRDDLTELRRKMPNVTLTDQLVPVAHSPAEKKEILKATGFEDRSGRGG